MWAHTSYISYAEGSKSKMHYFTDNSDVYFSESLLPEGTGRKDLFFCETGTVRAPVDSPGHVVTESTAVIVLLIFKSDDFKKF